MAGFQALHTALNQRNPPCLDLMRKQTELNNRPASTTRKIRFWSTGHMAESAYIRLAELRKEGRDADVRVLHDEWLI